MSKRYRLPTLFLVVTPLSFSETPKYVFSTRPADTISYRFPTHSAELILDRADAATSEAFLVILKPGESPPPHAHADTEQVFYLMKGKGTLFIGPKGEQRFPVGPGDLVRIPPGAHHRIQSEAGTELVYLSIDAFLGGRPAKEPTWESHLRVVCDENGWDFSKVRVSKQRK